MFNSLPEMFFMRAAEKGEKTVVMRKVNGRWEEISWKKLADDARDLASGFIDLGIQPGEKVAILSNNRYEWMLTDIAAHSVQAIDVPIYATNTPAQVEYILRDSESVAIVTEDQEQLNKVLQIRENVPKLKYVITVEGKGDGVLSFYDLLERGKHAGHHKEVEERIRKINKEDLATIIYTSGTTGEPKGVMLTHNNLISDVVGTYEVVKSLLEKEVMLAFLPWTHSFGRTVDLYLGAYHGEGIMAIAESIQKVPENIQEIKPTMFASVPRIFEKIYTKIISEVEQGPALKKKIFYWALNVGRKWAKYNLEGKPVSFLLEIQRSIADKLVFSKVREALGGRLKFTASGGGPLSKELGEIFYAMGIKIIEGYGLTETSPVVTVNPPDRPKYGSIGKPIPGAQLKIAEDGEILIKGPMVMKGYYNKPEATREAIDEEGWFHSGDIGRVDEEGYYYITDRKKDIIVTAGGKNIAPQPIENKLKLNRFIEQVVVIGDRRPYCVALIQPDFEELKAYAQEKGISYTDIKELLDKPEVRNLFQEAVDEVNKDLPRYSTIKKFELIPEPLTPESGELTPTLKVKRWRVEEKYRDLVEKMYS